jgi:excisionase family DNA binding protein
MLNKLTVSTDEAAEMLGVNPQTVARQIARKKLRASRVGRRVVIRVADIEKMLEANAA